MAEMKENTKDTNEYIVVVAKKIRNLGKKINNIKEIEKKVANGEAINPEQRNVLENKETTLKFYDDLLSIRTQMAEIRAKEVALVILSILMTSELICKQEEKNLKKVQKRTDNGVKAEVRFRFLSFEKNLIISS
jgi:hypothetical protein